MKSSPPGTRLGSGLAEPAAHDFALLPGTPVAAGLIDAHAGGVRTVGAIGEPSENLAYVFGTSSCTMTSSHNPVFVTGVWGPYLSAMVPGLWLNEGGQSATAAAIDHLLSLHPAATAAHERAEAEGLPLPVWLGNRAVKKRASSPPLRRRGWRSRAAPARPK